MDRPKEESTEIDLVSVFSNMGKRKKTFGWLLVIAIFVGGAIGIALLMYQHLFGKASYAQALVNYNYKGIESGLDPNGARLDVNKIKSPYVISNALENLGMTDDPSLAETIRQNIVIEGVIPNDAIERINTINQMAEKDPLQYEKVLDVSYYPSKYVVYLYDDWTIPKKRVAEILDAVLDSYRDYFYETYANSDVLTITMNLSENAANYDYGESVDVLRTQIRLILDYVSEKRGQSGGSDFRSAETGLSFSDIAASVQLIRDVDLAKLSSYIEENAISRDRQKQIDYYKYRIKRYNFELDELENQLANVNQTINNFEKDPVVIVSAQETTQEYTQSGEKYNELVNSKLSLTSQIAQVNTDLNETYTLLNSLLDNDKIAPDPMFEYADQMLESTNKSISQWAELTEKTTAEFYETTLLSNAFQVLVPAKYSTLGGTGHIIKYGGICVGACVGIVLFAWCVVGFKEEVTKDRKEEEE